MQTELLAARLATDGMLAVVAENPPSADTVNRVMMGRTLVARQVLAVSELALEMAGGAGFHRRPDWSGASAIYRRRDTTRCNKARRRSMPDEWREGCQWTGSSEPRQLRGPRLVPHLPDEAS